MSGTVWTPEMHNRLVALCASGEMSATQIARVINEEFGTSITRNSVLGRAFRHGVNVPGPVNVRKPAERKPRAPRIRAPRKPAVSVERPPAEVIKLRCAEVVSRNMTFAELGANGCRYPEGDEPSAYRFCGNKRREGSSYCGPHHFLCWMPAERRNRRAA